MSAPDQRLPRRGAVTWHELMTADPEEAKAFYGAVLGWRFDAGEVGGRGYDVILAGETPIGGMLRLDAGMQRGGAKPVWAAYVAVDALDEAGESVVTEAPVAAAAPTIAISVQFDTPGVGAVTASEGSMRAVPGVSSATTSSLALGGISVMSVGYAGDPAAFKAALEARGWQVFGSGTTLRIRRAPRLLPPDLAPDNATAG